VIEISEVGGFDDFEILCPGEKLKASPAVSTFGQMRSILLSFYITLSLVGCIFG